MEEFNVLDVKQPRIRTMHYTWIAFFLTFFVWFNMAPLATTMLASIDWLTKDHIKILAISNVALTIPARIIIGSLIDKYGPKRVFSVLMILASIPVFFFAFGDTFIQLLVSRLLLGTIGAGFVIGIKMMAIWFPKHMIGRAEGFYAGWGNFGSAFAAMTLPWLAITVFQDWLGFADDGWRYALLLNGLVCLIYGIAYPFMVEDCPPDKEIKFAKKAEPMRVTSYGDLVQYIVWSFPLVGAMGFLAWRIGKVTINGQRFLPEIALYSIYALLAIIYIAHVIKILQINLPDLKAGILENKKYPWSSVAALNSTYFANFGAELAVVSMLPMFFENVFKNLTDSNGNMIMTATLAGLVAASFAFVNLFARPLGGYLSDKMANRKRTMLVYMVGTAIGFFCMGLIAKYGPVIDGVQTIVPMFNGIWWLVVAIVITITCSVFVQGAEGATFGIIPMIKRGMTGQIAGMSGAYGNVGAVVYLVIYSMVDGKTFFYIISGGAALSLLYCLIFLKAPEKTFKNEY